MALDRQTIPVALARGIDTKTDPKQVVPGKLLTVQNGTLISPEEISKRNGYTALSQSIVLGGGSTVSAGIALAPYKNELVQLDGKKLYTYGESTLAPVSKGNCQPIGLALTDIFQDQQTYCAQDVAYHAGSGLKCVVAFGGTMDWTGSTGGPQSPTSIYVNIIDAVTGASVVTTTISGMLAGNGVKVSTLGKFFVICYFRSSDSALGYAYIASDTLSLTSFTQIATAADSDSLVFDTTVVNGQLFVGYAAQTSSTKTFVSRLTQNGSSVSLAGTRLSQTTSAGTASITVFGDSSNRLWVAWWNQTAIKALVSDFPTDPTLSNPLTLAPTTVETVANVRQITGAMLSSTQAQLYYEIAAATGYADGKIRLNTITVTGTVGTAAILKRSVGLASKAYAVGSTIYVVASFTSQSFQNTYFLLNGSTPVARFCVGLGIGTVGNFTGNAAFSSLPELLSIGGTKFITALLKESQTYNGGSVTSWGVVLPTFDSAPATKMVEAADGLYISGGYLWHYDGTTIAEHGFHVFPEQGAATPSTSGGHLADSSQFQYIYLYEWVDARGKLHRSAPSVALGVGTSNSGSNVNKITLTVPTLRLTQKLNVAIVVYRTDANQTIFYRNTAITTANDPTADSVTIVDTIANVTGDEQLYTTGGEVENSPGPATSVLATYKDRLIVVPSEAPSSWWYSKEPVPGFPIELSSSFIQNETEVGGDFTGASQMDDKLILLRTANPYYVVGNGPAPNGDNNDYQPAQIIVSDTGCNNAASVVLMPDGLMYQSPKGLYLLDRSLKDHYVGANVETYNGQTVTGAVLVPNTTQVRFTYSGGTALVYDYFDKIRGQDGIGQWYTFTGISAVSACIFQGVFCYLTSGGQVRQETIGTFTDAGAGYSIGLTTSWLKIAGLQGFQRIYKALILGLYKSSHTLQVQVAYDFDSTILQTENIPTTSTPPYQYRVNLTRQKCEAIQFTITDTSPTAESMSLSGILLEVGVKKGPFRMSSSRSFG